MRDVILCSATDPQKPTAAPIRCTTGSSVMPPTKSATPADSIISFATNSERSVNASPTRRSPMMNTAHIQSALSIADSPRYCAT